MSVLAVIHQGHVLPPPPPERPEWLDELLRHRPPMPFRVDPSSWGQPCPLGCPGRVRLATHMQGHGLARGAALAFDEIATVHHLRLILRSYGDSPDTSFLEMAGKFAASLRKDKLPRSMPIDLWVASDDMKPLFLAALLVVRTVLATWPEPPTVFMRRGWTARSPQRRRAPDRAGSSR